MRQNGPAYAPCTLHVQRQDLHVTYSVMGYDLERVAKGFRSLSLPTLPQLVLADMRCNEARSFSGDKVFPLDPQCQKLSDRWFVNGLT